MYIHGFFEASLAQLILVDMDENHQTISSIDFPAQITAIKLLFLNDMGMTVLIHFILPEVKDIRHRAERQFALHIDFA